MECLDYLTLWDIFDDEISIDEKMKSVNNYLNYLYSQEELLVKDKEKKEDYEKLKREIDYFLRQKDFLEQEYRQNLPAMLEETQNHVYSEHFGKDKRKEVEEQSAYLLSKKKIQ